MKDTERAPAEQYFFPLVWLLD